MTTMQRFVKKLGNPHAENIQIELSEEERAERRKTACDLRDQQVALAEEKKLAMAAFGQRKKSLENLESIRRSQAATGIEIAAVVVQDYLTAENEVVSIRIDNNAPVAKRTATGEELQDDLFGGEDDEPSGKPS
jgi:hypothetical protein